MSVEWNDIDHGSWDCVAIDPKCEAVLAATNRAAAANADKRAAQHTEAAQTKQDHDNARADSEANVAGGALKGA